METFGTMCVTKQLMNLKKKTVAILKQVINLFKTMFINFMMNNTKDYFDDLSPQFFNSYTVIIATYVVT